jgi:uncharacterized membrane protein YGL010W
VRLSNAVLSPSRITLEDQMALYGAFHRSRANRVLHSVTQPFILFSGFALLAPIRLPHATPLGGCLPWNAPLAIVAASVAAFAVLDAVAALAAAAWVVPLLFLADALAARMDLPALVALNLAVQAVAWFLAVQVGHERVEPTLLSADSRGDTPRPASSNLYFHRRYFYLRNVGRPASALESFQQFAIGPFATTLDVLFSLGYRPELHARIHARMHLCLARLARGEPILSDDSSVTLPPRLRALSGQRHEPAI